ncbi:MAG: DUF3795 domain-containing protein [Chloroflexota bacterium]
MSASTMAPCGLICAECPAFIATRTDDTATLLKCGHAWGQSYGREITADEVKCDGCRASGRKWLFCRDCALANCEKSSQFDSCAHCPDYPCAKVDAFEPDGRLRLEKLHAALSSR